MIKNVIFDMDGTILNTLDDLADSVNYTLDKCGYQLRTLDEVRSYVGNGIRLLMERALPAVTGDEFDRAFDIFCKHYDKNKSNKTAPYEGIRAAMAELKNNGIAMAVVSNKYDAGVKELTAELYGDYISIAIGESATVRPKPQPDGVLIAMQQLGATTSDSVYIGDSDVDFMTAVNSNLPFIGVTWGFRTRECLEGLGASTIIDHPCDIASAIDRVNKGNCTRG